MLIEDNRIILPKANAHSAKWTSDRAIGMNKFGFSDNIDTGSLWQGISDIKNSSYNRFGPVVSDSNIAVQLNITSTSSNDTDGGSGARTIRIWGLTDWDTEEETEDITLAGFGVATTTKSWLIIHRAKVLTHGGVSVNDGDIRIYQTTSTIPHAVITADRGQTLMCSYAIPSPQVMYITCLESSLIAPSSARNAEMALRVDEDPKNHPGGIQNTQTFKHLWGMETTGTSWYQRQFAPYKTIAGPAIVDIAGIASNNDTPVSATIDFILRDA